MQKLDQNGSHIVGIALAILVVGVIGFAGYRVLGANDEDKLANQSAATAGGKQDAGPPVWSYDQEKLEWFVSSGNAPECEDPIIKQTPVDITLITAVGLPGAYRGFSYKPHGGFRAKDSTSGKVDVKMPMDAWLTGITRYYESIPGKDPELQYLLSFESDCGIAFRFDHLATLTPVLQALAEKTPEPKLNDTSGVPGEFPRTEMKVGELVATEVGFLKARNYGFDFGVYDYRAKNKISENTEWAKIHESFSATTFHGVCWVSMLPGNDAAAAEAMAKDRNNYNSSKPFNLTSDFCEDIAPYNSLDFNGGQPTDG